MSAVSFIAFVKIVKRNESENLGIKARRRRQNKLAREFKFLPQQLDKYAAQLDK